MQEQRIFSTGLRLALVAMAVIGLYVGHKWLNRTDVNHVDVDPASVARGKALAENGRDGVPACKTCHGANGEGNDEQGFPRLAGLHPKYIAKQLRDFAREPLDVGVKVDPISRDYTVTPRIYKDLTVFSPGTRKDPMMNPIAVALSEDEILALADYYTSLAYVASPVPVDFETLERGQDLALRGKPEYMLPRCEACHGPDGEGFGEYFPPLAGQPVNYIVKQISKWQNGERDNDQMSMMKNSANLLTDGDKINVARYYSNRSFSINEGRAR